MRSFEFYSTCFMLFLSSDSYETTFSLSTNESRISIDLQELEEAGNYVFHSTGSLVRQEEGLEINSDNQVNTKMVRPSENLRAQLSEWHKRLY